MSWPAAQTPKKLRFRTFRTVAALMLREMATTYGRSPGGYIWAILEPAGALALMVAIFSLGFRHPPLGTNFAYFYAGGLLPLMMFQDLSGKLGASIQFSKALLEYPRVSFADALVARFVVSAMTMIMVHTVVLSIIIHFSETNSMVDPVKLLLAYSMVVVLGVGIGVFNAFMFVVAPLWRTVWSIITRPLLIVSGIFYLVDSLPKFYRDILWHNPMIHITGSMRDAYFPYYHPQYVTPLYVYVFGAVPGVIGLMLLKRFHREILDR